jgi:hypothetical protein
MSENAWFSIKGFFLLSGILYVLCAFSQYTPDVEQWSTVCRAVMGVGVLTVFVWAILTYNYLERNL